MKITKNAIRCAHCGTEIVSRFGHDFASHSCPALVQKHGQDAWIAADGGNNYLRRVGYREDWVEVSVTEPDDYDDDIPF